MLVYQYGTGKAVDLNKMEWPTGPGWESITWSPEEDDLTWIKNPLWVTLVGQLFGEKPAVLMSPDGEMAPGFSWGYDNEVIDSNSWSVKREKKEIVGSDFMFYFSTNGPHVLNPYLCGDYGFLDRGHGYTSNFRPAKHPWMTVGYGDNLCSALNGTLICLPEDVELFKAYGWE